jgi:hypothetical protein
MKALMCVIGLLGATSTVYGGIIFQQSVSSLAQAADLIVVGSASGNFSPPSAVNFSVKVARVIKGQSTVVGTAIPVQWNTNGIPGLQIQPGDSIPLAGNGIWFLQQSGSAWSLLPVVQGAAPFEMTYFPSPTTPIADVYAYAPTAALQDKLASELSAAVGSLNGSYNYQLYGLLSGNLDQLNSPVTQVCYQSLSTSTSVQNQILGLSGLIRNGSITALTTAGSAAANLFSSYAIEYGLLLSSIRDEFRFSDTSSIAALGGAAVDSTYANLPFREAAAHALAAIHSAPTLPYLAALLNDPDPALRVDAIGGMGAFANGLPVQTTAGVASLAFLQVPASAPYKTAETMANFAMGSTAIETNEASYLSFWNGWWSSNRASLGF